MLSSDEKIRCKKCHERGYHTRDSIYIMRICKYCGGRGCVDWIDHMTGNPSPLPFDESVKKRIVMRNVEHLMHQIKIILLEIDVRATIDVQATIKAEHHDIMHNHHCNIASISSDGKIEHRPPVHPKRTIFSL